jgi:azurin
LSQYAFLNPALEIHVFQTRCCFPLTLASGQLLAAECKVTVDSTDQMSNTKEITIDKSCKTFTVELTHSGNLPKNVMGHNWVLASAADMQPVAPMAWPPARQELPERRRHRIIAHTKVIGAGEKDSVTFDVSKLRLARTTGSSARSRATSR